MAESVSVSDAVLLFEFPIGIQPDKAVEFGKSIRSRLHRCRLHRWSFRELQEMIVYKAAAAGIRCVFLDPRYTSQTCSQCGAPGKRHKHGFRCSQCGHLAHSDLNASRNLQGLCRQLSAQGLM
ncbi:transposase [Duodenibacillus massiliensis]|uniref:transposase n=1 Tax=Duodenibacillus massiliensis TaxID=1852381 RepID=UPI00307C890E